MVIEVGNVRSTIRIGGKDHALPIDLFQELREYLRIRPDGYRHSPAYKKKQWDGWRYFVNKKGEFATGFLTYVLQYARDLGAEVTLEDHRREIKTMVAKDPVLLNGWELFDYQAPVLDKVEPYVDDLIFPRGVIDAATNAGKNAMSAAIHNNLPHNARTLFVVHRDIIFRQAVEFFGSMFDVGQVKSRYNQIDRSFVVAMSKTLLNRAKKSMQIQAELARFDMLIVDEAHRAGAADYSELLQMIDAPRRYLISGTPLDNFDKKKNMIIVGLSGPRLFTVTNQEVIDAGKSMRPIIHMHLNPSMSIGQDSYDVEKKEIVQEGKHRTAKIREICEVIDAGKQILIAVEEKAHGWHIFDALKGIDAQVAFTHGTDPGRHPKIEAFKRGDINILISTTILQEGANIPNIQSLIYAIGGKSIIVLKQFIGRLLRDDGTGDTVNVHDFYDVGKYVAKHSRKRIAIYKKEGFEIKYDYEHFRNKAVGYEYF